MNSEMHNTVGVCNEIAMRQGDAFRSCGTAGGKLNEGNIIFCRRHKGEFVFAEMNFINSHNFFEIATKERA